MDFALELLKGIGRLFLHPLTYLFLLVSFFVGLSRVKRERQNFHVRVFDFILEAKIFIFSRYHYWVDFIRCYRVARCLCIYRNDCTCSCFNFYHKRPLDV